MNSQVVNHVVANVLHTIAEQKDGYRKLAVDRAAEIIRDLKISVAEMSDIDLLSIKYIGDSTVKKIREILCSEETQKLIKSLDGSSINSHRLLREKVHPVVDLWTSIMMAHKVNYQFCGSWRRRTLTVKDLDIVIMNPEFMSIIPTLNYVDKVLWSGDHKISIVETMLGVQIDFRLATENNFGAMKLYFTGPKEFNISIRSLAKSLGMKLNEYGLYKDDQLLVSKTEEEIFEKLGMRFVEPQDRK